MTDYEAIRSHWSVEPARYFGRFKATAWQEDRYGNRWNVHNRLGFFFASSARRWAKATARKLTLGLDPTIIDQGAIPNDHQESH